jgi:intracellular multiplication protein IcmP
MAAGGGQGAGQQPSDNHMAALWIVVGLFVAGFLIWYLLKAYLVEGFFYVKLAEIWFLSIFVGGLNATVGTIHYGLASPADVPFDSLVAVANKVGDYMLFPVLLILIVLAVLLYFRSAAVNFHHVYDMKSLAKAELPLWPQLTPVIDKNLVEQHIEQGAWAMSLTPMQFAKKNELLKENMPVFEEGQLRKKAKITVSVIKEKAGQAFAMQLGPLWSGVEYLNPHTKALFAAFCARACGHAAQSREFLGSLARSSGEGKLDFSGTEELLKYASDKKVKIVIDRHAYVSTVMASILEFARTDGVLASADFLWLKPVDRRLWFLLNSIGRQTSPSEVGGPFAHWLAERELGRPIKTPMIEQAIIGLEEAIKEVIYHPAEEDEVK